MKTGILLLASLLLVTRVLAQSPTLRATLANSTHSYANLNVTTATGNISYNKAQITARSITFNNPTITLTAGSITAEDIVLGGAAPNTVNINSTTIRASGTLTIQSAQISLTTLTLRAKNINFTSPTAILIVKGNVKLDCDLVDFGNGTITVQQDPAGGSLTIECKSSTGAAALTYGNDLTVKIITK